MFCALCEIKTDPAWGSTIFGVKRIVTIRD